MTIKPFNVSGRTPSEIVAQAEISWLMPMLVQTAEMVHSDECRCNSCVQAKLDTFVTHSDELLAEVL